MLHGLIPASYILLCLFRNGGILPPLAAKLHKDNIGKVLDETLEKAGVKMEDIDAIATTVKPGNYHFTDNFKVLNIW